MASDGDFVAGRGRRQVPAWLADEGSAAAEAGYVFDLHFVKGGVAKFGKEDSPGINTISATAQLAPARGEASRVV